MSGRKGDSGNCEWRPPSLPVAAISEGRKHKSSIMIDLERDPLYTCRRASGALPFASCRAHRAGSQWKLVKKRTRFKFTETPNRADKNKKQVRNTVTLAALNVTLIIIMLIHSRAHAQLTMARSSSSSSSSSDNYSAAATGPEFLESPHHFPTATLGKFGLLAAGLRFDARHSSSPLSVAAFLGVPYAAPPTGLLRFMPPGAVRHATNQSHQRARRCQLLAANQSSGVRLPSGSNSRFFGEFGHGCVQLADWLSSSSSSSSSSSPGASQSASRGRQAEDCLNLNIFVPYEPTTSAPEEHKPRLARTTASVDTNRRDHKQRGLIAANQVADGRQRLAPLQNAQPTRRRRFSRGVNSSEANPIASLGPSDPKGAQSGDNQREKKWQSFHHYKQSSQESKRRLPVIVVFHSARGAEANSLAEHLSLVQRAQSIVITFNYRIGLLGYLPYMDPEEQTGAVESGGSGGTPAGHQSQTSRFNHAIWDQIGLLFWIKQNIAAFQGDPGNVTLLSGDNKAALQIQVLSVSPLAKGLFKRVVLTYHDNEPTAPGRDHLGYLFELATKSRELRRKLVSEMGLVVKRLDEEEQQQGNATKIESRFTGDRRVFEFLKVANLSQLARVEFELTKISASRPGAATIKLNDLISEPNLDDKMLFPYFAQLVKMNQSLAHKDDRISPYAGVSSSFWSFLQDNIDRVNSNKRPLDSTKMEVDYCVYLHNLHRGIFNRAALDNNMTLDELNQLDPYKLIPRLSEHQLIALAASTSLQQHSHSSTALDNNTSSLIDSNVMRWTRNRTANAVDFDHLRHAHLLQQLLVRKLESSAAAGNATSLVTLHQNIRRDNPSSKLLITLDDQPAVSNLGSGGENNEDEEDDENDDLSARQQHQLQNEQSSVRTKRSALDQLSTLSQQFIKLIGNYDLLISVSHDKGTLNQNEERSSYGLVETLLRVNNNSQIDHQLLAYLHLASLHYISTIKMSPAYLDELCDISSQYDSGIEDNRRASTSGITGHDIPSSYVVIKNDELRPTSIDHSTSKPILLIDEGLKEFAQSGQLTSVKKHRIYPYDTLNYRLNIGLADGSVLENETSELTNIHLQLIPYLERMLALHNKDSQPDDLVSCLGELESIISSTNNQYPANYSLVLTRLNEESYCFTNVANKLRNQLRSGAARELDPITRHYLSMSGEQRQQHRHMLTTKSTLKQQQLALTNGLTTRNLVNQSEGLYLDQLSPADQINNDQQMDTSMSANSSRIFSYDLNDVSKHGVSVKAANSTAASSLRGFFAKTYKDAVGQALGIVVGTGALIFLLNLIIVLIIALKSRRRIRSVSQHARDSSSDVIDSADQHQQQLKTLNSLLMADHQPMMNGGSLPTVALEDGTDQTKQLTSSFRDQQPRFPLSSSSQRVNKSIKFDLSGVEDQTRTVMNREGSDQQQQRGIMKQPILTTSDEDGDLPPSDQHLMPSGTCIHHSRENPFASHGDRILSPLDMLDDSLDLNGCDLNEMLVSDEYSSSQPQQQQQQQPTNFTQVEQNKCAHHNHPRHMLSLGSGSLTSPFASQSTPSNSVASCGQQIYTINHHNNSQGHQPGASHHMIIANTGVAHQNQNQHQHQQHMFYPLAGAPASSHTAAMLNSPSSSNTLSSAPTPILLAGSNEHLSPSAGRQMFNLIYPCDNLLMHQLQNKTTNTSLGRQADQLLVHLTPDQQHYLLNGQQRQ